MGVVTLRPSRIILPDFVKSGITKSLSIWDPITHSVKDVFFAPYGESGAVLPGGYELLVNLNGRVNKERISGAWPSKSVSFGMRSQPRTQEQADAIEWLSGPATQKMLSAPTGTGKTFVAVAMLQRLGMRAYVGVDRRDIADQWVREILAHTDLSPEQVVILSGQKKMSELLQGGIKGVAVVVGIHRTLSKVGSEHGWDRVGDFFERCKFGVKIFDEAHVEWGNIVRTDLHTDVGRTVYLTATPHQGGWSEDKMYQRVFQTVPRLEIGGEQARELRSKEGRAAFKAFLMRYDTRPEVGVVQKCRTQRGFNPPLWASWVLQSQGPYAALLSKVLECLEHEAKGKRAKREAVLVPTLEMVATVLKDLTDRGYDAAAYTGKTPKAERQKILAADGPRVIVTTEHSFGKALDVPGLTAVVVASPIGGSPAAKQVAGRCRGFDGRANVYWLLDYGFPSFRGYALMLKKVMAEIAGPDRVYEIGGQP